MRGVGGVMNSRFRGGNRQKNAKRGRAERNGRNSKRADCHGDLPSCWAAQRAAETPPSPFEIGRRPSFASSGPVTNMCARTLEKSSAIGRANSGSEIKFNIEVPFVEYCSTPARNPGIQPGRECSTLVIVITRGATGWFRGEAVARGAAHDSARGSNRRFRLTFGLRGPLTGERDRPISPPLALAISECQDNCAP
jgi:hypothetical protein